MIGTGARAGRISMMPATSMSPPSADIPYDMADRRMSSVNEGLSMPTALILRRLPLSTTPEAVKTMLLFAKDLQDTEMIANEYEEDKGYATALARFASLTGASEAQSMLNGRPNTEGQVNMIVEMLHSSIYHPGLRRNTMDPSASRPIPQAVSPRSRLNRYNGPFDNVHKKSPPPTTSPEATISDTSSSLSALVHPQSPRGLLMHDRGRVSGKSVIGEEDGDEETNGLIKDPLRYMRKDNPGQRKTNGGQIPLTNHFTKLSLHTEVSPQQQSSYLSPRNSAQSYSPRTPFSPGNGSYMSAYNPQFPRTHQFPPVNPADQNPPCNTLYVGNLPMDTSEDELKAMFSKQRGYKRLCFRTKQNGPMCFVEFEDISFATKALNDLYGAQLHNSVKGGIRLSFSKNPLGVRSGQTGSMTGPSTPLSSPGAGPVNGLSAMSPGGFSTANGPPPGLSAPPGFPPNSGIFSSQYSGLNVRNAGHVPAGDGTMYPDYMMGR